LFYSKGLSSPGFFEVKAAAGKVTSALMNAAKYNNIFEILLLLLSIVLI
jgi:hypothetical protein